MHHDRILSREEWFPARRRQLSKERDLARRPDQLHPGRCRTEARTDLSLTDWVRRHDPYEEDRKELASAA